jgi:ADP-ribose pyrophosphatase
MWDSGRSAEQVAQQEAMEEAACEVSNLLPIGDVWISPGTASERVMLYCGQVDATSAQGVHGCDDEGEDIRVVVLGFEQAMGELFNGRLTSSTAIMALQWLALNKERVRAQWLA